MAIKNEELAKLARGEGCLGKAWGDEPIFVLRAQDRFAPDIIDYWAQIVEIRTNGIVYPSPSPAVFEATRAKIAEARALAHDMRAWQERTGRRKVPD